MTQSGFPSIQRRLTDFLHEEEGNIPRSKIISVGSLLILLSVLYASEAFAKHGSHSSHSSHGSHGSHGSHSSHVSGPGHTSHGSHSSHSNHNNSPFSESKIIPETYTVQPIIEAPALKDLPTPNPNLEIQALIKTPPEVQSNLFLKDLEYVPATAAIMSVGDKA